FDVDNAPPRRLPLQGLAVNTVRECMEQHALTAVFQPIGYLNSGDILGYEALIRGPAGSPLQSPAALFEQARRENCAVPLERFAARACVRAFAQSGLPGKLFLNFSAAAIREIVGNEDDIRGFLAAIPFPIDRLVVELTEQASPQPLGSLQAAI